MGKGPQKREANGSIIPNIWKNKKCSKPPINNGIVKHQTWRIWTQSEHKEMWAKKSYRPGCCTMLHLRCLRLYTIAALAFCIHRESQGINPPASPSPLSIVPGPQWRRPRHASCRCMLWLVDFCRFKDSLSFSTLPLLDTLQKKKVSWLQWG